MPSRMARAQQSVAVVAGAGHDLTPTRHPPLPRDLSQLWLAPTKGHGARAAAPSDLATAVQLEVKAEYARALPILSRPALQRGTLADYATYYTGLAQLRLGRAADARRTFQSLQQAPPVGYLVEAAALAEAECDETLGDQAAAVEIYERLSKTKTTMPDDVLMRLGRAAKSAGDSEKATNAFARAYYEFPFSDLSSLAGAELNVARAPAPGSTRYQLELGRAERLFGSKRYAQARSAFEDLRSASSGDDRELVSLRIAECDYWLKRPRNARNGVRAYVEHAARRAEALFFYALATRDLGDHAEYRKIARRVVDEFPRDSWAEEALNNLATHDIRESNDSQADRMLRELYERFPTGRYAERAAWKIGWWAYKNGEYAETTRVFDQAAADFPRSDYRPPWLYWAGRAHEAAGEKRPAEEHYAVVAADYLNSYYGRLAVERLRKQNGRPLPRRPSPDLPSSAPSSAPVADVPVAPLPPNERVVRALLGLELYDQGLDELHYAQKVWGDSPAIQATIAWIYRRQGQSESGTRQFTLFRGAITIMRRAYPQFMAEGGQDLPRDVLAVIFPLAYWDLIKKYAAQRDLDPYLVAALVAQESTFVPDIRSSAKAVGLMQLMPSTARQYARALKLPYSSRLLVNPEANIRMGTAYLADKIREFGQLHLVLASYNAGERAVRRWLAERPGVERDEFIDDIPFAETQNYVKKILGTAEDYRRLYASGMTAADDPANDATPLKKKKAL